MEAKHLQNFLNNPRIRNIYNCVPYFPDIFKTMGFFFCFVFFRIHRRNEICSFMAARKVLHVVLLYISYHCCSDGKCYDKTIPTYKKTILLITPNLTTWCLQHSLSSHKLHAFISLYFLSFVILNKINVNIHITFYF